MVRDPLTGARTPAGPARRGFSLRFISEAYRELQRVTWPTREETMRLTLMVIAVAAAVGAFLSVVDIIFSRLMDVILQVNS
jgi:preprotein translocase subunit SecE